MKIGGEVALENGGEIGRDHQQIYSVELVKQKQSKNNSRNKVASPATRLWQRHLSELAEIRARVKQKKSLSEAVRG